MAMTNSLHAELFETFRNYSTVKLTAYLIDRNIRAKVYVSQRAQWISVRFVWQDKELSLSISLHHLDYQDGIYVTLKSKSGQRNLSSEVRKHSSSAVPVYGYNAAEMSAQLDRIIKDIKLYFEPYMLA
jgi:hypothetical protein